MQGGYLNAAQLRALVTAPPSVGSKRPGPPPLPTELPASSRPRQLGVGVLYGATSEGLGVNSKKQQQQRQQAGDDDDDDESMGHGCRSRSPSPPSPPPRPSTPPDVKIAQLASEFDSRVSGMGGVTALAMASQNTAAAVKSPAVRTPFGELSATYAKMFQAGQHEDDFRAGVYSGSQRRNERMLAHKAGLGWM